MASMDAADHISTEKSVAGLLRPLVLQIDG